MYNGVALLLQICMVACLLIMLLPEKKKSYVQKVRDMKKTTTSCGL